MDTSYLLLGIGVAGLSSILSRALPFIFLSRFANAPLLHFLGKQLPSAILIILVVYSLQDLSVINSNFELVNSANGWPLLVASLTVVLLHFWRRNTLLSILLGTGTYMFLIQYCL